MGKLRPKGPLQLVLPPKLPSAELYFNRIDLFTQEKRNQLFPTSKANAYAFGPP